MKCSGIWSLYVADQDRPMVVGSGGPPLPEPTAAKGDPSGGPPAITSGRSTCDVLHVSEVPTGAPDFSTYHALGNRFVPRRQALNAGYSVALPSDQPAHNGLPAAGTGISWVPREGQSQTEVNSKGGAEVSSRGRPRRAKATGDAPACEPCVR